MPVVMATKEFVLNYTFNRWQLGYTKNVGYLSKTIRKLNPTSLEEWEQYYYTNVRSRDHLDSLGNKLYENLTNIVAHEKRYHPELIQSISLDDCKKYVHNVVLKRTFDGFRREFG
jgi:hypothetical protein